MEWRSNQDVKTGEFQTGCKRKIGYLDNDVVKNLLVRFPGRGVFCEVINISKDAEAQLIYDVDLTVLPSVNIYRLLNIPDPKLAADNVVQKVQNDSNSYKPTKEQEISKGMIFNRKEQIKKLNKSGCYIAAAVCSILKL